MVESPPPALLVLEDGRTFHGRAFGAIGETFGEAVFATDPHVRARLIEIRQTHSNLFYDPDLGLHQGGYLTEAPDSGLEAPVEIGKGRRPAFEQGRGVPDAARVTLIHLTKGAVTPRTCPTHGRYAVRGSGLVR